MSEARDTRGDWMQTYTGRVFWPLDPQPEDICIEDIAHSLAMQCRFAGHTRWHYSVAQHSVLVSRIVERRRRPRDGDGILGTVVLAALLHDAAEAYLVDVPRPVKPFLENYKTIEKAAMYAVWKRFGILFCDGLDTVIPLADNIMLATEKRDVMGTPPREWAPLPEPDGEPIALWTPDQAEVAFLDRFRELTERAA